MKILPKLILNTTWLTFSFILASMSAQAQQQVEIEDFKSWLNQNWMLVASGILLLLFIIMVSRRRRGTRKTTTVIKDPDGHTKSVTTTEENI